MRIVNVYFKDADTKDKIHENLKSSLQLPDYYGRNLDALYDCLSEKVPTEELTYRLIGINEVPEELKDYAGRIVTIFRRVAEELGNITIEIK